LSQVWALDVTVIESALDAAVCATRAASKEIDNEHAAVFDKIRSQFGDGIREAAEKNIRRMALTLVWCARRRR
jgi:hypothetical protein